jgi:hypothetical protein
LPVLGLRKGRKGLWFRLLVSPRFSCDIDVSSGSEDCGSVSESEESVVVGVTAFGSVGEVFSATWIDGDGGGGPRICGGGKRVKKRRSFGSSVRASAMCDSIAVAMTALPTTLHQMDGVEMSCGCGEARRCQG